jgi:hypothetical protein
LPAKIRSPYKNDVVFVGHSFVQLHEYRYSGQLVATTAKLELGAAILDAKVISAELETVPTLDAILNQERDQEQYSIRGKPVDNDHPAQILVLVTADNDLIYLYARESTSGDVHLVFAKRPHLRGLLMFESECRDIAVDPQ